MFCLILFLAFILMQVSIPINYLLPINITCDKLHSQSFSFFYLACLISHQLRTPCKIILAKFIIFRFFRQKTSLNPFFNALTLLFLRTVNLQSHITWSIRWRVFIVISSTEFILPNCQPPVQSKSTSSWHLLWQVYLQSGRQKNNNQDTWKQADFYPNNNVSRI